MERLSGLHLRSAPLEANVVLVNVLVFFSKGTSLSSSLLISIWDLPLAVLSLQVYVPLSSSCTEFSIRRHLKMPREEGGGVGPIAKFKKQRQKQGEHQPGLFFPLLAWLQG